MGSDPRRLVIPLDRIEERDRETVGSKAANLARLLAAGFPVPPGFCVTSAALREDPRAIEDAYRALAADGIRVAVRSSATAEDLPGHSFAGQYDTFLGIDSAPACIDAIDRCIASLRSERAVAYCDRNRIDRDRVAMAVIVQKQIEADASGVMFTVDVAGGRSDRIVIEGSCGLGDAVVSGRVDPDRSIVAKGDLRILERSRERCIDDAMASRLADLAIRIERLFGAPQDIEWAIAGGEAFILQARPITTPVRERSWEERQIWTNANAGEVLPDVVTPMTWSIVERLAERLIRIGFGAIGLDLRACPIFGRIAGRAYFNLNTLVAAIRCVPMLRSREVHEIFGGMQGGALALAKVEIPPEDLPDVKFGWLRLAAQIPRLVACILADASCRARGIFLRVRAANDAVGRIAIDGLSDKHLVALIGKASRNPIGGDGALLAVNLVAIAAMDLYGRCRAWFGERGEAIASRLLSGIGGFDDANAGHDLWCLAAWVHARPEVERAILVGGDPGAEFRARWDAFLRHHGHHTRGEIELANPRWSETPEEVLDTLRSYLRGIGEADPIERAKRVARERRAVAKECRRRLRSPFRRALFDILLRRAERGTAARENLKSEAVRRLALIRKMLLALGERFVRRGILEQRDDIFFLRIDELDRPETSGALRIRAWRAEFARDLTVMPPPVVVGRFDPDRGSSGTVDAGARILMGLAVCPGVAEGSARVLLRSGDDQVLPGEILVAPFTDPGWTPYFVHAAGIVMDMGGLLSHGSIIAREYGIPTVVNVGPATRIIRTGDRVRVDGDRGIVELLGGDDGPETERSGDRRDPGSAASDLGTCESGSRPIGGVLHRVAGAVPPARSVRERRSGRARAGGRGTARGEAHRMTEDARAGAGRTGGGTGRLPMAR